MVSRTLIICAFAVLVLLSGCGQPSGPNPLERSASTPTMPPTSSSSTHATSTTTTPSKTPEVYVLNGSFEFDPVKAWNRTQGILNSTAGHPVVVVEPVADGGHVEGLDVFIDPSNTDNQPLLAHEFAHVIHFQNNPTPDVNWTGQQFAFKSYQEGLARWTEQTYAQKFTDYKLRE